jgi:hypothetical protein
MRHRTGIIIAVVAVFIVLVGGGIALAFAATHGGASQTGGHGTPHQVTTRQTIVQTNMAPCVPTSLTSCRSTSAGVQKCVLEALDNTPAKYRAEVKKKGLRTLEGICGAQGTTTHSKAVPVSSAASAGGAASAGEGSK